MEQKKARRNFFDGEKLDVRKLRHDMAGALGIVKNMIYLGEQDPANRAECDDILKQAVGRLSEINEALRLIPDTKGLIEVIDAK